MRRLAPVVALAMGCLVLAGWALDAGPLRGAGGEASGPWAALLLILAGLGLANGQWLRLRHVTKSAALVVAGLALAALATGQGSLKPLAACGFSLVGLGLALLDLRWPLAVALGQAAALTVFCTISGVLLGVSQTLVQAFGLASAAGLAPEAPTDGPVALGLLALASGMLLATPGRGLMAPLTGGGPAAQMGRLLMPAALLPAGLDRLRQAGEAAGWFDAEAGRVLAVMAGTGALAALVWAAALVLVLTAKAGVAERAAQAVEARQYMLLADNATDMIFRLSMAGVRLYASPASKDLLGYEPWELVGVRPVDQVHPDDRPAVSRAFADVVAGRERIRVVNRIRHKGGHYVWVEATLRLVRNLATGENLEIHGSLRDVGERKRNEAALTKQRAFFMALFEHSTDCLFVHKVQPNGTTVYAEVNAAAAAALGRPAEWVMGKTVHEVYPPAHASVLASRLQRTLQSGEVTQTEDSAVLSKAGQVWQVIHIPIRDADGAVERILVSLRDVTQMKTAERIVQEKARQMRLAEQIAGVGHWRVELPGKTVQWSDEVFRIHGMAPAAEAPSLQAAIAAYHPEDRATVVSHVELAISEGREYKMLVRLVRQDGEVRRVQAMGVPERGPDGAVTAVFGVFMDVTEHYEAEAVQTRLRTLSDRAREAADAATVRLHRLARQLAAARDQAERASQAKTNFVAHMSHELRTPLNGILGYAQLLRLEGSLDVTQGQRVDAMLGAGRHLLQMINSILELSQIEADRVVLAAVETDLVALVRGCLDVVRPSAQAKGLALRMSAAAGPSYSVMVDAVRLRQVLLNLLGNAVKFTVSGEVSLTLQRAAGVWRMEVADTGPGIPEDDHARLFQTFERLTEHSVEGAGLGLAISARLVDLMGGRIGCRAAPGGGCVFWVELPDDQASLHGQGQLREQSLAPAQALAGPGPCRSLRVLVVDDMAINRDVAAALLRAAGHLVACVDSGVAAIEACEAGMLDVVLMDVRMPGMDGLEAARRIRALSGAVGRVPIVAVTAQVFADQVERCRKAGMDGHVAKPFDHARLLEAVEAATREAVPA